MAWFHVIEPQDTFKVDLRNWLQIDDNNNSVPRGVYKIKGILDTDPNYESDFIEVELR